MRSLHIGRMTLVHSCRTKPGCSFWMTSNVNTLHKTMMDFIIWSYSTKKDLDWVLTRSPTVVLGRLIHAISASFGTISMQLPWLLPMTFPERLGTTLTSWYILTPYLTHEGCNNPPSFQFAIWRRDLVCNSAAASMSVMKRMPKALEDWAFFKTLLQLSLAQQKLFVSILLYTSMDVQYLSMSKLVPSHIFHDTFIGCNFCQSLEFHQRLQQAFKISDHHSVWMESIRHEGAQTIFANQTASDEVSPEKYQGNSKIQQFKGSEIS